MTVERMLGTLISSLGAFSFPDLLTRHRTLLAVLRKNQPTSTSFICLVVISEFLAFLVHLDVSAYNDVMNFENVAQIICFMCACISHLSSH
uniref:Uncharacterized protein MANES_17G086700 n=1 Tax=Rhizophora mucronata TaxID=61149 RepID=A0A2P2KBJ7_RHIMU